jgi:hypothetical protein
MASTLVRYCHEQSHDDAKMMATVTVGLSLATAILGLGLVGVGRLQLAQRVQLLPTWYVSRGGSCGVFHALSLDHSLFPLAAMRYLQQCCGRLSR